MIHGFFTELDGEIETGNLMVKTRGFPVKIFPTKPMD